MFTKTKKFTALALSFIVLAGATNVQVFAATTIKDSKIIDGTTAYASHTGSDTSSTATATYARSGVTLKATASIFYINNGSCYGTKAESISSAGGVTAVATKKISSGQVIGTRGELSVEYKSNPWTPILQIGTCADTYIRL